MIRAVPDVNVFVSLAIKKAGHPAQITSSLAIIICSISSIMGKYKLSLRQLFLIF